MDSHPAPQMLFLFDISGKKTIDRSVAAGRVGAGTADEQTVARRGGRGSYQTESPRHTRTEQEEKFIVDAFVWQLCPACLLVPACQAWWVRERGEGILQALSLTKLA